jgi:prephenate dehydrogenase
VEKRALPKNAAIVGLGWWGQHIMRQTRYSEIVRIVRAIGSHDEHRANAEKYGVSDSIRNGRAVPIPRTTVTRLAQHM